MPDYGTPPPEGFSWNKLLKGSPETPTETQPPKAEGPGAKVGVPPGPGPADYDLWARVLTEAPSLEPAVCRMAHELAYRVDRLRACGNGVVPLVAAVSFLALRQRFRDG